MQYLKARQGEPLICCSNTAHEDNARMM